LDSAFDFYSGKELRAEDAEELRKRSKNDTQKVRLIPFACTECGDDASLVSGSGNLRPHFRHATPHVRADPCSLRVIEADSRKRVHKKFIKDYDNMKEKEVLLRAINKSVIHYLSEARDFFGGDKNVYFRVKESGHSIIFKKEMIWKDCLTQMRDFHVQTFRDSKRHINEVFFKTLLHEGKMKPHETEYKSTIFHQIFFIAVSSAAKLTEKKIKYFPHILPLKELQKTIHNFDFFKDIDSEDFFKDDKQNVDDCRKVFEKNIGNSTILNFSDMARLLIAERFTKIILELDILGFLLNPEEFYKKNDVGFVYLLKAPPWAVDLSPSNKGGKPVVKVGQTQRLPEDRANELSQGLLWDKYEVIYFRCTQYFTQVEKNVLKILKDEGYSVAKNEYFDVPRGKAIKLINNTIDKFENEGLKRTK